MNTQIAEQPVFVFQITPRIALSWTSLGSVLFLLSTIAVASFYQAIHQQSWVLLSIAPQNFLQFLLQIFLLLILIPFATFAGHELIHGIMFTVFGGSPRYGVGLQYGLPYAYATSPGDRFSRNAFLVIILAPFIVLDILGIALLAVFPQAPWLGWVVILNTAGAIGDWWIATLLLRCPTSIVVEDRQSGVAFYVPVELSPHRLPFRHGEQSQSWWVQWINLTLLILLVLILLVLLLPILLGLLNVPSFQLGTDAVFVFQWQNDPARGFGINFNPLILAAIALLVALVFTVVPRLSRRR